MGRRHFYFFSPGSEGFPLVYVVLSMSKMTLEMNSLAVTPELYPVQLHPFSMARQRAVKQGKNPLLYEHSLASSDSLFFVVTGLLRLPFHLKGKQEVKLCLQQIPDSENCKSHK